MDTKPTVSQTLALLLSLLCTACVGALAVSSFVLTGWFPGDYSEIVYYTYNTAPLCLAALALVVVLIFLCERRAIHLPSSAVLSRYLFCFSIGFGAFWVLIMRTTPSADSAVVKQAAESLWQGDYTLFGSLYYMEQHPYQVGLCLFEALFFKVVGFENVIAFQLLNLLCAVAALWFLCKIAQLIFANEIIHKCCILCCFFAVPLLLNTTVVYGNLISYPLNFAALYFVLRAVKEGGIKYYALCAVCIALAKILKPTSLIFLIAIVLFLAVRALLEKNWRFLLAALCIYAVCSAANEGVLLLGEAITGGNLHAGQPMISWFAMGLQESPLGFGWYNEYVDSQYVIYQGDAAAITASALVSLQENILNFLRSPGYTLRFFGFKIFSQWCEPSFGGFWNSNYNVSTNFPEIRSMLLYGQWHVYIALLLDAMQFLVYSFAVFGLWARRKAWTLAQLVPALAMMGGFAYSILFEAKSFYVLPYYLLLFPYAAVGVYTLHILIAKRAASLPKKQI